MIGQKRSAVTHGNAVVSRKFRERADDLHQKALVAAKPMVDAGRLAGERKERPPRLAGPSVLGEPEESVGGALSDLQDGSSNSFHGGADPVLVRVGRDHHVCQHAKAEAAFADLKMIGQIAQTMGRHPEHGSAERRGPISLNVNRRKRELTRVAKENRAMLARIERARPAYQVRDHLASYRDSRKHVVVAMTSVPTSNVISCPVLPSLPSAHTGAGGVGPVGSRPSRHQRQIVAPSSLDDSTSKRLNESVSMPCLHQESKSRTPELRLANAPRPAPMRASVLSSCTPPPKQLLKPVAQLFPGDARCAAAALRLSSSPISPIKGRCKEYCLDREQGQNVEKLEEMEQVSKQLPGPDVSAANLARALLTCDLEKVIDRMEAKDLWKMLPAPLVEKRQTLEAARRARLSQLGVSQQAIDQSELTPVGPAANSDIVRVMQYNILADGLSDDGFLVRPVLADWPVGPGRVPTSEGTSVEFSGLLSEMLAGRGDEVALHRLKKKYDVPAMRENFNAVVDWQGRLSQLQLTVLGALPDIVIMQELDHYGQLAPCLAELGYTSKLPSAIEPYAPAHLDGHSDRTSEDASVFRQSIEVKGHAFLPHLGSNSLSISLANRGLDKKVIEVAQARGLGDNVVNPKSGKLARDWTFNLPGGSAEILKQAGVGDPCSLDDMGVAVFWRQDRFTAETLKVDCYGNCMGGLLQVRLREISNGRALVVIGSHLASGDSLQDEKKRLDNQVNSANGIRARAAEILSAQEALILSLDANSDPMSFGDGVISSCWTSLHSAVGASVWDGYFDPSGATAGADELDQPVTSNKIRGPLSGQHQKIGSHSYCLVDHIYFSPALLNMQGHVRSPHRFSSSVEALESVQPSLGNPSDHYPVVVDLSWAKQPQPGAVQRGGRIAQCNSLLADGEDSGRVQCSVVPAVELDVGLQRNLTRRGDGRGTIGEENSASRHSSRNSRASIARSSDGIPEDGIPQARGSSETSRGSNAVRDVEILEDVTAYQSRESFMSMRNDEEIPEDKQFIITTDVLVEFSRTSVLDPPEEIVEVNASPRDGRLSCIERTEDAQDDKKCGNDLDESYAEDFAEETEDDT